jgi:hypothetical protein
LDSNNNELPAIIGVTVTDESVVETIEKRKQVPNLISQVFIEKEVDHLEDANFYLSNDKNSDIAMVNL